MLALIGAQAVGGLFANDDIASEGPLVRLVSKATSDSITVVLPTPDGPTNETTRGRTDIGADATGMHTPTRRRPPAL